MLDVGVLSNINIRFLLARISDHSTDSRKKFLPHKFSQYIIIIILFYFHVYPIIVVTFNE